MKYDLVVAMPLGVSVRGTPVHRFLQNSIESILQQETKYKFKLIIAADKDIPEVAKKFIEQKNIEVCWYEPHSYFRKGGIWKKIYDQWDKMDSKYVSFCHYDDIWKKDKIEKQISFMERNKIELSWSKVFQISENDDISSIDLSIDKLTKKTIFSNSYAFCHSSFINKESLRRTGIEKHKEAWSANYEKLFFVYSHKLKTEKCSETSFYHRSHSSSITNTFCTEDIEEIRKQRKETGYSLENTLKDADSIDIKNIIHQIMREKNENNLA